MRYVLFVTFVLAAGATAAADPFYLRYDPNEGRFPEQEGWGRYWDDPEDKLVRSAEHGVFRLDTRGSASIFDLYEIISPAFSLQPGEELHISWRMRTLETDADFGRSDVVVAVINEFGPAVQFFLAPSYVGEDEVLGGDVEHLYFVDVTVPHTYDFVTDDMSTYQLYVDGNNAFSGVFHDYAWRPKPRVTFGDAITGYTSLSEWEYVQIEVVPECRMSMFAATVAAILTLVRRR
ncbi:MAG: hypothetical protein KKB50_10850 [Planctomycetes bacterium]|nr:hypothetical protein [Planctomycetota bacterium]